MRQINIRDEALLAAIKIFGLGGDPEKITDAASRLEVSFADRDYLESQVPVTTIEPDGREVTRAITPEGVLKITTRRADAEGGA